MNFSASNTCSDCFGAGAFRAGIEVFDIGLGEGNFDRAGAGTIGIERLSAGAWSAAQVPLLGRAESSQRFNGGLTTFWLMSLAHEFLYAIVGFGARGHQRVTLWCTGLGRFFRCMLEPGTEFAKVTEGLGVHNLYPCRSLEVGGQEAILERDSDHSEPTLSLNGLTVRNVQAFDFIEYDSLRRSEAGPVSFTVGLKLFQGDIGEGEADFVEEVVGVCFGEAEGEARGRKNSVQCIGGTGFEGGARVGGIAVVIFSVFGDFREVDGFHFGFLFFEHFGWLRTQITDLILPG